MHKGLNPVFLQTLFFQTVILYMYIKCILFRTVFFEVYPAYASSKLCEFVWENLLLMCDIYEYKLACWFRVDNIHSPKVSFSVFLINLKVQKLLQLTHFSLGKTWFEGF